MAAPYTSGPHIISGSGGQEEMIELRCPSRGTIVTIKFDHVSGVDADCVFELYSKQINLDDSSSSSASAASSPPNSAYSIFGSKTYQAGTPFFEKDQAYNYQNNDAGPTNRKRRLYLRLLPSGTGLKEYALTMEMDVSPL